MIASSVLCVLMFFEIMFFVILNSNFTHASIVYALFLFFVFAKMIFAERKKIGSGVRYRRLCQIVFAVGFCIAFISDLYQERGSMTVTTSALANAELPFCHIAIPQIALPLLVTKNIIFPARITGHYAAVASMLLIWFICTITIGRGWCSWVCFYGGWEEGFSHIAKKQRVNLLPKNQALREFHFGFLFFIALASLCELACVYCQWFCPFKLITEFSPITSIPTLIATVLFIALFLSLSVALPILTKKRVQCSNLCPFGAFASLTDRFSMFKITIDTKKCVGCMKCAMACPFGAIDVKTIQEKKGMPEITCAKCGECINACPEKIISYDFRSRLLSCSLKSKTVKTKFGQGMQYLLHPAQLFTFASFTFFVIMSSSFMIRALNILANSFINFFARGV